MSVDASAKRVYKKIIPVMTNLPIEYVVQLDELRGEDMSRSAFVKKIVREYLRRLDRID